MLKHLEAAEFRNFTALEFDPAPGFNLIFGANGSGKSSVLESISLLGVGRSFRSHLISRVIKYNADQLSVFGLISPTSQQQIPAGIEKSRDGSSRIKINGTQTQSASELAKIFPLQLINHESYQLVDGGPKFRRQFLDWGVFHVEHSFFSLWKRVQHLLQQRNAELRLASSSRDRVKIWDRELVKSSLELNLLRTQYLEKFIPVLAELLGTLIDLKDFTVRYQCGWDESQDLSQLLEESFSRDRSVGYTHLGPHRADLQFKIGKMPVHAVLSRGEQKLLVYALRLAQGLLLRQWSDKHCTYLIDDLPAELDMTRQSRVMTTLASLQAQVFVTGTHLSHLQASIENNDSKVFHVEHCAMKLV